MLLINALLFAVVWMAITGHISLASFVIGFLVSLLVLSPLYAWRWNPNLRPGVQQGIAFVVYTARMFWLILISSLDVARRVLDPRMPIKPGIIGVPAGDNRDIVAALSAHSITVTPGELVVNFDGAEMIYVHCLDAESAQHKIAQEQEARARALRQILWGQE